MSRKSTWLAALAACMFAFENKIQDSGMYHNPDYRVKQPKRNLQSFIINDKTIEAYSRKDAIKRLKHKDKFKHDNIFKHFVTSIYY